MTDDCQIKIRLPERTKRLLEQIAKECCRSLNAEIVHRLENFLSYKFNHERRITDLENKVAALEEKIR